MSKILNLQAMAAGPSHAAGNSDRSNTCQGNSCISLFCGGGKEEAPQAPAPA